MRIPDPILLATGNPEKVAEWQALLAAHGLRCDWQVLPEVEEDAATYEGNARLKAVAAAAHTGRPALGDDAGLEVDALSGAPGLWTRRWAADLGGWEAAREALARQAGSRARFYCGLALAWPAGPVITALGSTEGVIVAAGAAGVGLEPSFQPDGAEQALPDLPRALRDTLHYRVRAWRALVDAITAHPGA